MAALPLPFPALGGQDAQTGGVLDMGTLRTVLNKLNMDNSLLLKAKRERDISEQVTLYSNPISKRVVEHNMRMQDHLMDSVHCVTFGVQVLVATPNNLPQVNLAFSLVLSPIQ